MKCKICGAENIQPSMGGIDVCPECDMYGLCKRCKTLIKENRQLRDENLKLKSPSSLTKKYHKLFAIKQLKEENQRLRDKIKELEANKENCPRCGETYCK